MNKLLINQALEALMSIGSDSASREAAANQQGPEAFAVAKSVYDFVVNYPVDWSTTLLTDELINSVRMAVKSNYPFLPDKTIWRLGNHFAYLWK